MAKQDGAKTTDFNYQSAFSRNIGWVTHYEQLQLKTKKVVIAGCGGVGGIYLLTMARLGVTHFHIADFDEFEIHNFNRQVGANMTTIHHRKVDVLKRMAEEINPEVKIKCFSEGINDQNLDEFLEGADLYLDGMDFFVLDVRAKIFQRCYELNIPAITAGPVGMGSAYMVFLPHHMSFEEYFRLNDCTDEDKQINFLIGLTPHAFQRKYLMDLSSVNFKERRSPSTMMACNLCAGIAGTEALKILLHRPYVYPAPYYHYFDAYTGKFHRGKLWFGNRSPIQKIKRFIIKKLINKNVSDPINLYSMKEHASDLLKILDLSRWAPSGDNTQPWQFEIINAHHANIYLTDHSTDDIYDFAGIPTLLSGGALLENIRLASAELGYTATWQCQKMNKHTHKISLNISPDKSTVKDNLFNFIPYRSVERNSLHRIPLDANCKHQLQEAVGDQFEIEWHETLKQRWHMSTLNFLSTDLRLRVPELFDVHANVIDVNHTYSRDKMPLSALGMSPFSALLTKYCLHNKRLLNLLPCIGATYTSGIELDLVPGLLCSAHFSLFYKGNELDPSHPDIILEAGQAIQRFWLTASRLGLVIQPTLAPIIFTYYINHHIPFTNKTSLVKKAEKIATLMNDIAPKHNMVFRGRIGLPRSLANSRSIRKNLEELLINNTDPHAK